MGPCCRRCNEGGGPEQRGRIRAACSQAGAARDGRPSAGSQAAAAQPAIPGELAGLGCGWRGWAGGLLASTVVCSQVRVKQKSKRTRNTKAGLRSFAVRNSYSPDASDEIGLAAKPANSYKEKKTKLGAREGSGVLQCASPQARPDGWLLGQEPLCQSVHRSKKVDFAVDAVQHSKTGCSCRARLPISCFPRCAVQPGEPATRRCTHHAPLPSRVRPRAPPPPRLRALTAA